MSRLLRRYIFRYFAKYLGRYISIDTNLVLFGAMNGKHYGDNSRHVYEWILDNKPDLNPVWITGNVAVYNVLKNNRKPVVLSTSFRGFLLLFKARVGAYTNGLYDLSIFPALIPPSLKLVLLTHGSGAKGVRYARSDKLSEREDKVRQKESSHIAYLISTSEFVIELDKKTYRLEDEKYIITGYPRNDSLFTVSEHERTDWELFLDRRSPNFTVLYGPTWRHGRHPTMFFPFDDLDVKRLLSFLEDTKTLLLLRPHIHDLAYPDTMSFIQSLANQSDMIMLATHDSFPDSHLLMRFADALVSDYSGLIHDYLLLDRPLVFIPYDYSEYKQANGFLYDYFENLPGKPVYTFDELISHLQDLIEGKDPYRHERHALCNKIHLYKDPFSCRRVSTLIEQLLGRDSHGC